MEILTGPKGGKYYINDKGKKIYLKKSSDTTRLAKTDKANKEIGRSNNRIHIETREIPETVRQIIPVPDYEHEGDIQHEINHLKEKYPYVKIIRSWEERDYEAESDYEEEYGELDEYIYQGYIEVEIPKNKINEFI